MSKAAAYTLAQKKRLDRTLVAGGVKAAPRPAAPLLSTFIAEYVKTQRPLQKTADTKLAPTLAHFLAVVRDRLLDGVTDTLIEDWRRTCLAIPLSANTVQRRYNSVRGMFREATERGLLVVNPCERLADYAGPVAPRRLWRPDEQWLVNELPDRYRLPLKVGFLCGCRRTEVLSLTKHDLGPTNVKISWIFITRLKKRAAVRVRVPIAGLVVRELAGQLKTPFQLHVFGDPSPEPNSWSSLLTRKIRALGKTHHIDTAGLCMHGTRHTATTLLQDTAGVSSETTREMGGWTTTRMVETYSHPQAAGLQRAAEALAANFRPTRPRARRFPTPNSQQENVKIAGTKGVK